MRWWRACSIKLQDLESSAATQEIWRGFKDSDTIRPVFWKAGRGKWRMHSSSQDKKKEDNRETTTFTQVDDQGSVLG